MIYAFNLKMQLFLLFPIETSTNPLVLLPVKGEGERAFYMHHHVIIKYVYNCLYSHA